MKRLMCRRHNHQNPTSFRRPQTNQASQRNSNSNEKRVVATSFPTWVFFFFFFCSISVGGQIAQNIQSAISMLEVSSVSQVTACSRDRIKSLKGVGGQILVNVIKVYHHLAFFFLFWSLSANFLC